MKIKSLLLGSAAAMMAVSTAQAADIIIPEPEVVEYVRVCDAAGAGYFYIPGSETCLRIGGYVRYDVGFGELNGATHVQVDANGNVVFDAAGNPLNSDETWRTRARAELEFDTWTDTELGVLRTAVTLRFQHDTNDVGVVSVRGNPAATPAVAPVVPTIGYETVNELGIRAAYIDLAGLRIGKDESYFTQFTGYAGAVINDTTAGGYGPFDTNLIAYTFDGGAFSATLSLEQGDETVTVGQTIRGDRDGDGDLDYVAISDAPAGWGIDDYVPHIVAGAGYDAGAFQVRGVFGYDTRDGANQGGWSGKIRGDVDFDPFRAFIMLMYGENSSAYTTWANGPAGTETFSVIGGASFAFTDAATFNTQVQWAEANGLASDEWAVAANINYEIVDDFIVRPELVYHNTTAGNDVFGGTLRFQRSF